MQINVIGEYHSPRDTRSQTKRSILQNSPFKFEEGENPSDSIAALGSESNADSGSQSTDNLGVSAES